MNIKPYSVSIGRVFREEFIFRIPKYQRDYAWTETHIDDFWNDLIKCYDARIQQQPKHHFLGGIVTVEQSIPGSSRRHCDVVDGQQRLATIIILVSCIIKFYKKILETATDQNEQNLIDLANSRIVRLKDQYLEYEDEVNRQPTIVDRLELSGPDKYFFKQLIKGDVCLVPEDARESHKRLFYAYNTIMSNLNSLVDSFPDNMSKMDALSVFEEILNIDFSIIHIVTDTRNEAYQLFQVLNDRGTSLTEGDLLRAKTLELLDNQSFAEKQRVVEEAWDEILKDHPDKTTNFLRWYYASNKGKFPGPVSLFDDFLEAFFPAHKKAFIDLADADAIVNEVNKLLSEIMVLRKLIEGTWPFPNQQSIPLWDKSRLGLLIKELEHTHSMPLLLAAYRTDDQRFSEIVQLLERFFFRYKLICKSHIGPLTKTYLSQCITIRQDPASYSVSLLRTQLRYLQDQKAPDATFRALLDNLIYNSNGGNKPLKYFLITIEYFLRWYIDGAHGLPTCLNKNVVYDFSNTTIEHIYPRNPTSIAANPQLDEVVNCIGNLTFLGPHDNNIAGNEDFESKKAVFRASPVLLNQEIGQEAEWNRATADNRQERLKDIALVVFTM
jgi:hypothetical protein